MQDSCPQNTLLTMVLATITYAQTQNQLTHGSAY